MDDGVCGEIRQMHAILKWGASSGNDLDATGPRHLGALQQPKRLWKAWVLPYGLRNNFCQYGLGRNFATNHPTYEGVSIVALTAHCTTPFPGSVVSHDLRLFNVLGNANAPKVRLSFSWILNPRSWRPKLWYRDWCRSADCPENPSSFTSSDPAIDAGI